MTPIPTCMSCLFFTRKIKTQVHMKWQDHEWVLNLLMAVKCRQVKKFMGFDSLANGNWCGFIQIPSLLTRNGSINTTIQGTYKAIGCWSAANNMLFSNSIPWEAEHSYGLDLVKSCHDYSSHYCFPWCKHFYTSYLERTRRELICDPNVRELRFRASMTWNGSRIGEQAGFLEVSR